MRLVPANQIKAGDWVDLSSCPYLRTHPSADFEYARVSEVTQETPTRTSIYYEGIDLVGYSSSTALMLHEPEKETV